MSLIEDRGRPYALPCVLSVVIPAYNEAKRLARSLELIDQYCQAMFESRYEVIVVNDGSSDSTADCLESLAQRYSALRVINHSVNTGKGAAVRTGMLQAQGKFQLFTDADCATPISEEESLRNALQSGADIAAGSRTLRAACRRSRSLPRLLIGWAFRKLVDFYVCTGVTDSQCGFKMFTPSSRNLFRDCDENGYLFDIFVLMLARQRGMRVDEIPVQWMEVPGSKVRIIRDSYRMFRDLKSMHGRVHAKCKEFEKSTKRPHFLDANSALGDADLKQREVEEIHG